MGASFYISEESSSGVSCCSLGFSLVLEYVLQVIPQNPNLMADQDLVSRFEAGANFDMVSLRSCRNKSLTVLSSELEKALSIEHRFWVQVANSPRFQKIDWPNYSEGNRTDELLVRLHHIGCSVFEELRTEIMNAVEDSIARRSKLGDREHVLVLLNDFIQWSLRCEAAQRNTTVQHVAKELKYKGVVIAHR